MAYFWLRNTENLDNDYGNANIDAENARKYIEQAKEPFNEYRKNENVEEMERQKV